MERLHPEHEGDWLIVGGDVGEVSSDIEWALDGLARRFSRVIWVPGNHELWTRPDDPVQLRGDERYRYLVEYCRGLGIATPEDSYPVWTGSGGPVVIAPLFTLYDYSFLGRSDTGVVCTDEVLLHPYPFASVAEWCAQRVAATHVKLASEVGDLPTVLVGHFPLRRDLTRKLMYPDFARWCGTVLTSDWHRRFNARAVVYGHLHIPWTTVHDGVPFHEVSLGYPRQWRARRPSLRPVLAEVAA